MPEVPHLPQHGHSQPLGELVGGRAPGGSGVKPHEDGIPPGVADLEASEYVLSLLGQGLGESTQYASDRAGIDHRASVTERRHLC